MIKVETVSETVEPDSSATVKIYENEKLIFTIIGSVLLKKDGNGGNYPVVHLQQTEHVD